MRLNFRLPCSPQGRLKFGAPKKLFLKTILTKAKHVKKLNLSQKSFCHPVLDTGSIWRYLLL
jgi:hypothetical protein